MWHCSEAAKLGEGAVNLAVEHVLVTDDFEQRVAVGKGGGKGATGAAKGFVTLGGFEFNAEVADFFLVTVDNAGKRCADEV